MAVKKKHSKDVTTVCQRLCRWRFSASNPTSDKVTLQQFITQEAAHQPDDVDLKWRSPVSSQNREIAAASIMSGCPACP
jgi:hypothetical protein